MRICLLIDGRASAPHTADGLRRMIAQGLLSDATVAAEDGGTAWVPLRELLEKYPPDVSHETAGQEADPFGRWWWASVIAIILAAILLCGFLVEPRGPTVEVRAGAFAGLVFLAAVFAATNKLDQILFELRRNRDKR